MNNMFNYISLNYLIYIILLSIMFFIYMNYHIHPLHLTIIIILFTSLICFMMNIWYYNHILSILLFLTLISGMFIIITYFTSTISNEQSIITMNPNQKYLYIFYFLLMMSLIYYFFLTKMPMPKLYWETMNSQFILILKFHNIMMIYMYPSSFMTVMSMLFLMLALFSIIKISNIKSASLRKLN